MPAVGILRHRTRVFFLRSVIMRAFPVFCVGIMTASAEPNPDFPGVDFLHPSVEVQKFLPDAGKSEIGAVYNSVLTKKPVIALTFDDGPHGVLTPKLLDILRAEGVRVTFFVLGENVSLHPDVARRMVAEGHEIASHTWSHPSLPSVGAERFNREIQGTTDIIEKTTGQRVTLMRPPYGALNARVKKALLEECKLDVILWSVDPYDWKRPGAAVITRRLVAGAHPGAILLAHDIHPGTIAAVPDTIAQLKARGYSFVTVSELLAMDERSMPPLRLRLDALPISPDEGNSFKISSDGVGLGAR